MPPPPSRIIFSFDIADAPAPHSGPPPRYEPATPEAVIDPADRAPYPAARVRALPRTAATLQTAQAAQAANAHRPAPVPQATNTAAAANGPHGLNVPHTVPMPPTANAVPDATATATAAFVQTVVDNLVGTLDENRPAVLQTELPLELRTNGGARARHFPLPRMEWDVRDPLSFTESLSSVLPQWMANDYVEVRASATIWSAINFLFDLGHLNREWPFKLRDSTVDLPGEDGAPGQTVLAEDFVLLMHDGLHHVCDDPRHIVHVNLAKSYTPHGIPPISAEHAREQYAQHLAGHCCDGFAEAIGQAVQILLGAQAAHYDGPHGPAFGRGNVPRRGGGGGGNGGGRPNGGGGGDRFFPPSREHQNAALDHSLRMWEQSHTSQPRSNTAPSSTEG